MVHLRNLNITIVHKHETYKEGEENQRDTRMNELSRKRNLHTTHAMKRRERPHLVREGFLHKETKTEHQLENRGHQKGGAPDP